MSYNPDFNGRREIQEVCTVHGSNKTGMITKLCENTKNYRYAYPGSNKVVNGACEQESEEKNSTF